LTFRRNFGAPEWRELENELTGIELTNEADLVRWALNSHGSLQCTPCMNIGLSLGLEI
jgi:hypothetical protein